MEKELRRRICGVLIAFDCGSTVDVHPSFHDLVDDARILVPELHSLIDPSPSTSSSRSSSPVPSSVLSLKKAKLKLHVSLSRPLYVRKDQRPSLEAALRDIVADTKAFQVSFSKLRVLRNDEQTRIFLGVDVAAGYPEVRVPFATLPPLNQY